MMQFVPVKIIIKDTNTSLIQKHERKHICDHILSNQSCNMLFQIFFNLSKVYEIQIL